MRFDVILTNANTFAEAFSDSTMDLIRLDGVSVEELGILAKIVERSDSILIAALPYEEDNQPICE